MKNRVIVVLVLVLCLGLPTVALAYETSDEASAAYQAIESSIAEIYGIDSETGLTRYPESFGGAWIDEDNYLVVALTDISKSTQNYYIELSGNGDVLKFVEVQYSLSELLNLFYEIYDESQVYTDFIIEEINFSLVENAVTVSVMADGYDVANTFFSNTYGDMVIVSEGSEMLTEEEILDSSEEVVQSMIENEENSSMADGFWRSIPIWLRWLIVAVLVLIMVTSIVMIMKTRQKEPGVRKQSLKKALKEELKNSVDIKDKND